MSTPRIYINGKLYDKADAKISVYDHGLLYGDGLFEVLRTWRGIAVDLDRHLDRLYASWRSEGRSVASRYSGTMGLPAVIDARDFDALLDDGLPIVVARSAAVPWPDGAFAAPTMRETLTDVIRRRIS